MFKPMFELSGMGDPWEYWGVHAPSDRSRATIIQNSRFGIGDVTFCALIYGIFEYKESTVKRFTKHTVHLANGDKLPEVQCVVKSLGLIGDFEVDRLHKMKELIGNWCSGDYRRVIQIDPLGMNAANFTTFSTGIGTYGGCYTNKWLHDYPQEYSNMVGQGLMQSLPRQKADEKLERPAYVTDVKFQMAAGIIVGSLCPKLAERGFLEGEYKHEMYHRAHPTKKFFELCIEDWDKYQKVFKERGFTHEYVPYPYTIDMVTDYFADYNKAVGLNCGVDGPKKGLGGLASEGPAEEENVTFADILDKKKNAVSGTDDGTKGFIQNMVNSEHLGYWMQTGPKQNTMLKKNTRLPQFAKQDLSIGSTV